MCMNTLRDILFSLRNVRFSGASCSDLSSYSRIFTSLFPVFSSGSFDMSSGLHLLYNERAKSLCDALLCACRSRCDLREKAELLCCLFSLQPCLSFSTDTLLRKHCLSLSSELFSYFLCSDKDDESLTRIMLKAICLSQYPAPIEDSAAYLFFRQTLSEWAVDMLADGSWTGVLMPDGLERLLLLNMNSYMFLDKRYDDKIRSCYSYYSSQPLPLNPSAADLKTYGLLCDASLDGNAYKPDERLFYLVSSELSSMRQLFDPHSSSSLYCQSYESARLCHNALFSLKLA